MMMTAERCPSASKRAKRIAALRSTKTPSIMPSRSRAIQRPRRSRPTVNMRRPILAGAAKRASCAMARLLLRESGQLRHRQPEAQSDRQRSEGKKPGKNHSADRDVAQPGAQRGAIAPEATMGGGGMMARVMIIRVMRRHVRLVQLPGNRRPVWRKKTSESDIKSRPIWRPIHKGGIAAIRRFAF